MSDLAVLTCVYKRPERLRYTLDMLSFQTVPADVWVINNNPDLCEFVEEAARNTQGARIRVVQTEKNRGPFARIEMMHELWDRYDWFLWVDDDLRFGSKLIEQWMAQREPETVKAWKGYRFVRERDYWHKAQMPAGEECDYLIGSNLLAPASVAAHDGILKLAEEYRLCCDDLWLCYWSSVMVGMRLVAGRANVSVNVDGKDTYICHHDTKIRFLDKLRSDGWAV